MAVGAFNNRILYFHKNTNENIRYRRLNVNTKIPSELFHKAINTQKSKIFERVNFLFYLYQVAPFHMATKPIVIT